MITLYNKLPFNSKTGRANTRDKVYSVNENTRDNKWDTNERKLTRIAAASWLVNARGETAANSTTKRQL